jgi:hypothetical protein
MTTSHGAISGRHPEELREYRRWFLALGTVLLVLGVVAMVAAFAATMVTVLFFGILLLIAGVVQIVHALSAMRWQGFSLVSRHRTTVRRNRPDADRLASTYCPELSGTALAAEVGRNRRLMLRRSGCLK